MLVLMDPAQNQHPHDFEGFHGLVLASSSNPLRAAKIKPETDTAYYVMRVPYQRQLLYIINREIELRLGADSYEGKLLKHLMEMVPPSLFMGPSIRLIVKIVGDIQKKLGGQKSDLELKEIVFSIYKTNLSNQINLVLREAEYKVISNFDWELALAPPFLPPQVGLLKNPHVFAASCLLIEYNPIDYTAPEYGYINYLCGSLLARLVIRMVLSRKELRKKSHLLAVISDERIPTVSGLLFECLVAYGVLAERHARQSQTDLMSVDESSAPSSLSSSWRLRQLDPVTSKATPLKATTSKATPLKATTSKATTSKATPLKATTSKATTLNAGDVVATLTPTFVHPILGTTTPTATHNEIAAALKDLAEQHGSDPWSALLDFQYEKTPTVDGAIVECVGKEVGTEVLKLRLYPVQTTIAREKTLEVAMTWVKGLRKVLARSKEFKVEVPYFSVLRPSMNDPTMISHEDQLVKTRQDALPDCKYTLIDHDLTAVIKDTDASFSLFRWMVETKIDMIKAIYDDSLTGGQRPYRGLSSVCYPNPYGDDSTCPSTPTSSSASTTADTAPE
jgi:hypothetical protein